VERRGSGLGLNSPGVAPRMEGGDWEVDSGDGDLGRRIWRRHGKEGDSADRWGRDVSGREQTRARARC
jgi:hypothetical protein